MAAGANPVSGLRKTEKNYCPIALHPLAFADILTSLGHSMHAAISLGISRLTWFRDIIVPEMVEQLAGDPWNLIPLSGMGNT